MFKIAIHGGAGSLTRSKVNPSEEEAYQQGLVNALEAGYQILAAGGTALDAVEMAVVAMENNPIFNAGRGSVFTSEKTHEMDAAMMCGRTLRAGAVAGISHVRNPVQLARTVLEKTENVLLSGQGAEAFARQYGLRFEDDSYFYTEHRYGELLDAQQQEQQQNVGKGTVGAVALDVDGNIAAATSTGGLTNKRFGRVGDTPVIGAGTYANNETCAVSCTGTASMYFARYRRTICPA